jgi:hypothetical protein
MSNVSVLLAELSRGMSGAVAWVAIGAGLIIGLINAVTRRDK